MRRQLETCQETFSSRQHQQNSNLKSKKSKLFLGEVKESSQDFSLRICHSKSDVGDRVIRGHGKNDRNTEVLFKNQTSSDLVEHERRHEFALKFGSNGNQTCAAAAGDYVCKTNIAVHPENVKCEYAEQPRCRNPILDKLRRPPVFCSPSTSPKSKKFSSASPSTSLDQFLVPTKPGSPRKHKKSNPARSFQIRIEPGPNLEPAKSLDISKYKRMQTPLVPEKNDVGFMDSTQHRIKEFLDKTCADAARSRTQIGPAVSLSDLASIDEQQTSMPILVEGVLAPEERKRQVSKVYPMRTPSPLHASHLFGAGHSTRSNSRVMRAEHPGRPGSPFNLPPIILPPIRENKEFQPRRCSWSSSACGEEDQPLSKPVTEEDWRSLRKCRYLRIPQSAEQACFMDSVESVFK